jgi:hypothetical protein
MLPTAFSPTEFLHRLRDAETLNSFDTIPADLQAMVPSTATEVSAEINPWILDFMVRQRKLWVEKGGELETLSPADKAEMMVKVGSVAEDIVKTKPELNPMWELLRAAAKRSK